MFRVLEFLAIIRIVHADPEADHELEAARYSNPSNPQVTVYHEERCQHKVHTAGCDIRIHSYDSDALAH